MKKDVNELKKKGGAMFHRQLMEHFFVPVPLSISQAELELAVMWFLRFLEEVPDEVKRQLHFKSPFYRGTASGYNDKRNLDGKDPKEFFHFDPSIMEKAVLKACFKKYPVAAAFLQHASSIYEAIDRIAVSLVFNNLPELADQTLSEGRIGNGHLRFLCYTPSPGITFNAKGHYDKGIGTLALAESTPGLRIGCCKEHSMKPVLHEEGTAIFMPGDLAFLDSGIIPAWHDVVVPSNFSPVSERCERWAVVFFINDKDGRYSEWDDVHNPFQVHAE